MNKLVHLGLSILELSKILVYEVWYDYVKPKYDEKEKLCYIDTESFNCMYRNKWYLQRFQKILQIVN